MAHVNTQRFQERSRQALQDARLQGSLASVVGRFHQWRTAAVQEFGPAQWEELRTRAREIKRHTLDNLDYYLELLSQRIAQAGGQVLFAADAQEAAGMVLELARSHGVKMAVKSKSMVSEEMDLNRLLAQAGVEAVETDLGEFIVQLAGESPFHIIAPAMHKSREEVAELFHRKLGAPRLDDIPALAAVARHALRDKFMRAEMGITGANFLIAETGTLVLVTNEGNGRFCTSTPRIHVAIAGMEKLLPSLEDLGVFLRLLPRSATGQRMSSYMTFVTGPRRQDDEDGPAEFYVILVDNGRMGLLRDPEMREALYCIRCGACLNICPIYRKVGGHAYGHVYPGPIGSVVTPALVGVAKAKDLPSASTLCGACREVCPIKIDIPHMLLNLRHRAAEGPPNERKRSRMERIAILLFCLLMTRPRLLGAARTTGRWLMLPLARNGRVGKLPLPILSRWTRRRDLPVPAPKTFHQMWKDGLGQDGVADG